MQNSNSNDSTNKKNMRWEAARRMEFIEFRLYWEGRVNRGDLTNHFGISVPQASNDISRYQELNPGNIDYDRSGKFYFATLNFTPTFYVPSSNDYLSQISQLASGIIDSSKSNIKTIPSSYVMPELERPIANQVLRELVRSINSKADIKIKYQSLSSPDPSDRWIAPQSLAYDGFRWHIRAYCFSHEDFRDFSIGRIWEIIDERGSSLGEVVDHKWKNIITLHIGANPNLSTNQKKTIEKEYGMDGGIKVVKVRESFLFYFLKRYGLNYDDQSSIPKFQQIVILNPDALKQSS